MHKVSLDQLRDYLEEGRKSTKTEIAEHLKVSERHVQRLIQELREAGVTIVEEQRGRKVVYFTPEQHRPLKVKFHTVKLTQFQLVALAVAARASEAVLDSTPLVRELETANARLLDTMADVSELEDLPDLREEADRWYFPDAPRVPLHPDVIATLAEGMRETYTVEISYYSASSRTQRWRKVDPMTFVYRDGSWLLCAWCHNNAEHRTFSLADVHDARLARWEGAAPEDSYTDEKEREDATPWLIFTPRPFDVEAFFRDTFHAVGGDTKEVQLHVAAPQAPSFRRKHHHPTQQIKEVHPDGSIDVTFKTAGLAEVRSFILGWGEGVTVLEPEELRRQLREVALEVARKYG